MQILTGTPQERYDVIVVGSGAGALTAAATAARGGCSVLVLEKSELLGGTSAVSGGMLWLAENQHAATAGLTDSRTAAAEYVRAISRGRGRDELIDAAIGSGAEMLHFLETECGLRMTVLPTFPDYRDDLPGATQGGRTLEPALFPAAERLGELHASLRVDGRAPFTMQEYEQWGAFTRFPWEELAGREELGFVAKGQALVAMLLASCQRDGVVLAVNARAERLLLTDGRVTGVQLDTGAALSALSGVVLATGGFEWDRPLADSLLSARLETMCSPPSNTGDGLRMAQRIGAQTRGTREAWWAPMALTGDTRDGEPIGTLLRFERQGPGSIMVNPNGERFANESQNYNDLSRALHSWDPARHRALNTPAHVVFDQRFLRRYGLLAHRAGQPLPPYLRAAATLAELAEAISVPPNALQTTVRRFNECAHAGVDPDFARGASPYDRYWGDEHAEWPNPALGPLEEAPFYALPILNGAFGTNGGVATNGSAQVLTVDGTVIPGCYAVGNVAESPFAAGYPGAGATLGPLMTMAYLAGRALSGAAPKYPTAQQAVQ